MNQRTLQSRLNLGMVLALFAVGGCGGAAPGASSPTASSPVAPAATTPTAAARACELLTDADIESIMGVTVVSKADNVQDTVYANHCRWTLKRSDGGTGSLDLGVLVPEGRERYDHSGGASGLERVEGLPADDAGIDSNTGSVFAVRGDTLVDVFTVGMGSAKAQMVEVARRVLEHLFGLAASTATPPTGGQATGGVSDPCSLLTDDEILEVTGRAPSSHEGGARFGAFTTGCIWQVQGAGMMPATITVLMKNPGGRASWDQYLVPIQGEFTAVPGLGDAAFAKVHWPTHVVVGDTYVSVQFVDSPDPEGPISTELARRVVEKVRG